MLDANVAAVGKQMRRLPRFRFEHRLGNAGQQLRLDEQFSYLDFLRDIGKNFPVNVMLAKDSVKSRLERDRRGLSYTEFSYMLLQATISSICSNNLAANCRSAAAINGATSPPASIWPGGCMACSFTASPARC